MVKFSFIRLTRSSRQIMQYSRYLRLRKLAEADLLAKELDTGGFSSARESRSRVIHFLSIKGTLSIGKCLSLMKRKKSPILAEGWSRYPTIQTPMQAPWTSCWNGSKNYKQNPTSSPEWVFRSYYTYEPIVDWCVQLLDSLLWEQPRWWGRRLQTLGWAEGWKSSEAGITKLEVARGIQNSNIRKSEW